MDRTDDLLSEQAAYYRARAHEYDQYPLDEPGGDELVAALGRFEPGGEVLELACGTGIWTAQLLPFSERLTALDGAPEMLRIARSRIADPRVRWVQADIFDWTPAERYDVVSFAFWLSHVPLERFAAFWNVVGRALRPGGRVFFVDDAFRTPEELIEGEGSSVVQRRLSDGTAYRAIKVPHTAGSLQTRLREIGWDITVTQTRGPFFWGQGTRRMVP